MAISTYNELKTALANWLGRGDLTATRYEEMISLAEAKLQRVLRTTEMETRNAAFTINAEYVDVPSDFLGVKSFYLNTNPPYPVRYMSDDQINGLFNPNSTGIPKYFTVQAGKFRFAPSPDGTYSASLAYFKRFIPLGTTGSATTTTNFVLSSHPDLYLYGALSEAEGFLVNDQRIVTWKQQYQMALDEVNGQANKSRWSGPGLAARIA